MSSESSTTQQTDKSGMPTIPWLRPIIAIFSCVTGLMYGLASFIFYILFVNMRAADSLTETGISNQVSYLVNRGIDPQEAKEEIANIIEVNRFSYEQLGDFFPLILALIVGVSLILFWSGIGFFTKKKWAISMGRLACISLVLSVIGMLVYYQPAIAAIAEKRHAIDPIENYKELGWMIIIRYMFLCSMCPVVLIISFGLLVKQNARESGLIK